MSDREYDELINRLEAIVYPIVFVVFALLCAFEIIQFP